MTRRPITYIGILLYACWTVVILAAWLILGLILATLAGYQPLSWGWLAVVFGWAPIVGLGLLVLYLALLLVASALRMVFGRG